MEELRFPTKLVDHTPQNIGDRFRLHSRLAKEKLSTDREAAEVHARMAGHIAREWKRGRGEV